MNLIDLISRDRTPAPWSEGDNIPWNEPEFSARMLKEHLSQAHDAASRRLERIERHVGFIHRELLNGQPAQVLDLACGPGLYAQRLARLGHRVTGIDYSPASVKYARQQASDGGLYIRYELADLRQAEFGTGFNLAMLIYGEFNVFPPAVAADILRRARAALLPGGRLLLEPHTLEGIRLGGEAYRSEWWASKGGLYAEQPHLVLEEQIWDEGSRVRTDRYYVVDAATAEVNRMAASYQAYDDEGYRALLTDCGFEDVRFYPGLDGTAAGAQEGLFALTAAKREF